MTDQKEIRDSDQSGRVDGNDKSNSRLKVWWQQRTRPQRAATVAAATLGVLAVASIAPIQWWYSCGGTCPTAQELRNWQPSEGGRVLDRDGKLVSPLTPTRRQNVPLEMVPEHVRKAFIAVEDRRFYEHNGVDWRGVARAFVSNAKNMGVVEGASTISMQLARNVFLADRATERSLSRKLLEWRYAVLIEDALTKEEILQRYLNAIYLGNGVYGVEGASQDLFGKSVSEINVAEAALLAGLPKAPSVYTPRNDVDRALERRNVALGVMLRERVIDSAAYREALNNPVKLPKAEWKPDRPSATWASEFARLVVDSLVKEGDLPEEIHEGQLIIYTTIDARAQRSAAEAVDRGARRLDGMRGSRRAPVQGALVALDPQTGAIRAIVGGRDGEVKGFDRATRARRQPGSAFKPFVYAAALQQGFTAATMLDDVPVEIPDNGRMWRPANYDHQYSGRITMRDALTRSANAATVRLSRDIGLHNVISVARAAGITSDLPAVPSLALGAGAVTPLELTAAYAAFGNGGMRVVPHMVLRIDDVFGRTLWTAPPPERTQAMTEVDAFLITSMLRSVVDRGTGYEVRAAGVRGPVAGKTGTTNDGADVWFVGYTPTIVAAVWFGNDKPQPLGGSASGGRVAAPAWASFIKNGWHSPEEDVEWYPPPGVVERWVDVATGMRADEWCGASRKEWFRMGSEPIASCTESMMWASLESGFGDVVMDTAMGTIDTIVDTIIDTNRLKLSVQKATREMNETVQALLQAAGFSTSRKTTEAGSGKKGN